MKLASLIAAAAIAVAAISPAMFSRANANETMKYPKVYAFLTNMGQMHTGFSFNCSYTTRQCVRGYFWREETPSWYIGSGGEWQVFELIDDHDRTTVLAHIGCYVDGSTMCWNFDNGRIVETMLDGEKKTGNIISADQSAWPIALKAEQDPAKGN